MTSCINLFRNILTIKESQVMKWNKRPFDMLNIDTNRRTKTFFKSVKPKEKLLIWIIVKCLLAETHSVVFGQLLLIWNNSKAQNDKVIETFISNFFSQQHIHKATVTDSKHILVGIRQQETKTSKNIICNIESDRKSDEEALRHTNTFTQLRQ